MATDRERSKPTDHGTIGTTEPASAEAETSLDRSKLVGAGLVASLNPTSSMRKYVPTFRRWQIISLGTGALVIGSLAFLHLRSAKQSVLNSGGQQIAMAARTAATRIQGMRTQTVERARLAARLMASAGDPEQRSREWASAASDSVTDAWIVTDEGILLSASQNASLPDSSVIQAARRAASRGNAVVDVSRSGRSSGYFIAAAPIRARAASPGLVLVQRYDARRTLARVLPFYINGAPSARITLISQLDETLTAITLEPPDSVSVTTVALAEAPLTWRRAVSAGDTVGTFPMQNGHAAYAATARTPTGDWGIVLNVDLGDTEEAFSILLRMVVSIGLAVFSVLATVVLLVGRAVRGAELRQAREGERRLAGILSYAPDAFIVLSATGSVTQMNPAARRLFGVEESDLIGRSPLDLLRCADRQLLESALADARSVEINAVADQDDLQGVRADGTTFPADARLWTAGEGPSRVSTLLVRDASSRLTVEQRLQAAAKLEAVGRLAGGVAHEFNNKLMAISACTEFLMEDLAIEGNSRDDLLMIRSATGSAAGLTAKLLSFGRRLVLQPTSVRLDEFLMNEQEDLRALLPEDVVFTIVTPPEPIPVMIDHRYLRDAVINLVLNSRDAMQNGGRLTIRLQRKERDDAAGRLVQLVVEDTGKGMDEETRRRAFEPFFTTKEFVDGGGLGLASVHGLIVQSGGNVTIDSAPGAGTRVIIELPIQEEMEARVAAATTSGASGEMILVVDDERAVRTTVARALQKRGYNVLQAENGVHALDLFRQQLGSIDLLLTDVVMPQMSGFQLASEARRLSSGIPILMMSGYTYDEIGGREGGAHTQTMLLKPFTCEELAVAVRSTLDHPRLAKVV